MGIDVQATNLMLKKDEKPVLVFPSRPTPDGLAYLSNIDHTVMFPVETLYFYPPHPHRPTDHTIFQRFKSALSEVLVPYYYAAGRLTILQDTGRFYINCNSAGALFAGATSDISMADLGEINSLNPSFRSLVIEPENYDNLLDQPLLKIQVTRFKCGGFVIGMTTNHCLCDGLSAIQFLQNYASIIRGEGLIIQPHKDRTCLMPRSPPHIDYEHHELVKLSDIQGSTGVFSSTDIDPSTLSKLSESHSYRLFHISHQMIVRLKAHALQDGSLTKCSSFEALVAHIWQSRTKAMDIDPSQQSAVLFAVDIRKRIQPPLPPGFYGNGVKTAYARASVEEICSEPLSFCVRKMQEGIQQISDGYIRSAIDWLEVHRGMPAIQGNFYLSSWWRLPFNGIDFGWGKAKRSGPLASGIVDMVLLLASGDDDQEVDVVIVLTPEEMAKFEMHLNAP